MNKIFFVFSIFIFSQSTYSKCISDIYSMGLSADSHVYNIKRKSSGYAQVASSSGYGLLLGKIILCPSKKIEFNPYFRLRKFNIEKPSNNFKGLEDTITLPSIGSQGRYFYKKNIELVMDIEFREEYKFSNDDSNEFLYDGKYWNWKSLFGARYFIKSNKKEDYTVSGKLGPLIPLSDEADYGYSAEVDLEYFKRINRKYSIRADIYYSIYSQEINDMTVGRSELGLRYNYIFRY